MLLGRRYHSINGVNEETPQSHEYKRQLRLQKQCEQSQARLACETKEEHQRRLQLHREARKGREQNRRAEEKSQEAQKRLKAQRQGGASRYQCQTAEQSARRLPDNSKLMLTTIKMKQQQQRN